MTDKICTLFSSSSYIYEVDINSGVTGHKYVGRSAGGYRNRNFSPCNIFLFKCCIFLALSWLTLKLEIMRLYWS
jgi:hypothetical protein